MHEKMKLEEQVVSLKQAQTMKQLGFPQQSAFYWYYLEAEHPTKPGERVSSKPKLVDKHYRDEAVNGAYEREDAFLSAYTVPELGEMLVETRDVIESISIFDPHVKQVGKLIAAIHKLEEHEATNRARLLIYLRKNKLI
jgi:hypothetical protein